MFLEMSLYFPHNKIENQYLLFSNWKGMIFFRPKAMSISSNTFLCTVLFTLHFSFSWKQPRKNFGHRNLVGMHCCFS